MKDKEQIQHEIDRLTDKLTSATKRLDEHETESNFDAAFITHAMEVRSLTSQLYALNWVIERRIN